jgi:hypothetical protein
MKDSRSGELVLQGQIKSGGRMLQDTFPGTPTNLSVLYSFPCCIPIRAVCLPVLHAYPCCMPIRAAFLSVLHSYPCCIPIRAVFLSVLYSVVAALGPRVVCWLLTFMRVSFADCSDQATSS